MSAVEEVLSRFTLPAWIPSLRPNQVEAIEKFGAEGASDLSGEHGLYHDPGTGKTLTVLLCVALAKMRGWAQNCVVLIPPITARGWANTAKGIVDKTTGEPLSFVWFAGTRAARAKLDVDKDVIALSYAMFRRSSGALQKTLGGRRVMLGADEAHALKNTKTTTYALVSGWFLEEGMPIALATGTPITTPRDCYAYIKLLRSPGCYSSQLQFERTHVAEEDERGKVLTWDKLDLLSANFAKKATRAALDDLPESPPYAVEYDLEPAHMKLYHSLLEDRLLELEDGSVIHAFTAQKLRALAQQITTNWGHFSGVSGNVSAGYDLVTNTLDEIGEGKLVVFVNYQITSEGLLAHLRDTHGGVGIRGGMTERQRNAAVDAFTTSKECRVIVLQFEAGGVGLDGLQHVCRDSLFLEIPTIQRHYLQAQARLVRTGQKHNVRTRLAFARGTVQVANLRALLNNDELVNEVVPNKSDLRKQLFGV